MENKNKPIHTLYASGVKLAIWQNGDNRSISVSKNYKTQDGTWNESKSFFRSDLLELAHLCERAVSWLDDNRQKKTEQAQLDPTQQTSSLVNDGDDIPF